jgi:hypothetical protein
MAAADRSEISYRKTTPPGAGQYDVVYRGQLVGTVGRFRLAAGQFGSRWMATTPARKRSTQFMTREAAADWLITQSRA